MLRLFALLALIFAACSGPGPTPQIVYVTPLPTEAASAAPTQSPSPQVVTHDLTVEFALTSYEGVEVLPDGTCTGAGGYSDLQLGLQFNIEDTAGNIVAFGTFTSARNRDRVICTFHGRVDDVPDMPVYVIDVGRRGAINFTRADLEANNWLAEMSIGD